VFDSQAAHLVFDSFFPLLWKGLLLTLPITIASFAIAVAISVVVAVIQLLRVPVLSTICRFYIWVFRGTPLLVQLYIVFFGFPSVGVRLEAIPSAIIVFALNTGAYTAETVRASIEAVPQIQMEAGLAAGMTYLQTMRRIVLPQAFRSAFPTLSSYLIGLVKDTSLAANITVVEMFRSAQIIAAAHFRFFALYCEVAVIYLLFCSVLTRLQTWGERKLALPG
jgi:cystine transport system permease protein